METTRFLRPGTLAEAVRFAADSGGMPFAGGTDLMVRMRDGLRPGSVVDLTGIVELRGCRLVEGILEIGALATHADLAASPLVQVHATALAQAASLIGSPAIRSRGTIGGNVANASPAADTVPALFVLAAEAVLAGPDGERIVPVESFATGPGRTVRRPGEILVRFRIPVPVEGFRSVYDRLGPRRALAISKVSVAIGARVYPDGTLGTVRVALGAVGPIVLRARGAEAALEGRVPSGDVLEAAMAAASADARAITDIRSTAEYRTAMCGILLRRSLSTLLPVGPW
jgi:carbon-monoxide dehydrogenase medium subunit